ncbi:hypothetical protein SEA_HUWBERT_114 [Microbacterium phage Huwbert]|nr:hypothetical protein SEA_HUWBERT_6 [Microbacterium phage Huwbert]WNO27863.1 hypothetical protein SEA_HUWBERT_114 [Microbacterium phage Huwbert]
MTLIPNTDTIAERIIDAQYDDDIHDHDTLRDYLNEYYDAVGLDINTVETADETHAALTNALDADITDLLKNGNELLDEEEDSDLLNWPDVRHHICSLVATKLIARIYPEGL